MNYKHLHRVHMVLLEPVIINKFAFGAEGRAQPAISNSMHFTAISVVSNSLIPTKIHGIIIFPKISNAKFNN